MADAASVSPRPRRDVLIVEDDTATQMLLMALMGTKGLTCSLARDGIEALERLSEYDFAAIILDLVLPRLNGFDLMRRLAAERPELPPRTIILTAASEWALHGFNEVALARVVLLKPTDIESLADETLACVAGEAPRPHTHRGRSYRLTQIEK